VLRRLSLITGIVLIAVAFGAATRVANTREGLIAEVITLLAGLAGMTLVFFGLFSGLRPGRPQAPRPRGPARPPSARDFVLGAGGLVLAALLIGGWGISAGWQWAALSVVVLLPMIVGSAVLCVRFLRAR
jgi:hypothetical protein